MSFPSNLARTLLLGGTAGGGAAAAWRYRKVVERQGGLPTDALPVFADREGQKQPQQQDKQKQRVIVVGAGVVGVATAYKLAQMGHSVAILEPRPESGEECSACAAGGMQRSNPVVDRDSWVAVFKCIAPRISKLVLGGPSESFRFFQIDWYNTLSDPFFLRWVMTFTKTSLFPCADQNQKQQEMLKFTDYAVGDMVKMMEDRSDDMSKKSGYNNRGSLSVSYNPIADEKKGEEATPSLSAKKKSKNPISSRMNYEPSRQVVGVEEVLKIEPSLRFQEKQPTSAKHEFESKSASSGRFAKELARRCAADPKLDVKFYYETRVEAISTVDGEDGRKPRIGKLHTNRGVVDVPDDVKVVVTAGAWIPRILSLMGLYAPVYPLKGYAMSVSAAEALRNNKSLSPRDLPSRIVCDKYMYTTRLGDDDIRITSIGEFSGWSTAPTPHVEREFRLEACRQFPQLKSLIDAATARCGHRPFVNDGILLLGEVDTHDGLYVSCGPGSNGWKLAMGSGEVIARLVSGQAADEIKRDLGCDVGAFSPAGRVLEAPLFSRLCRARWNV